MTVRRVLALGASALALSFGPVLWAADEPAQHRTDVEVHVPGVHVDVHKEKQTHQPSKIVLEQATEVIGTSVVNPQGESLGKIRELAIDARSGQVAYAVLEYDEWAHLRDKYFAIPWQALEMKVTHTQILKRTKTEFVLDVPGEKLKNAPGFDKNHWPQMANPDWAREIHTYYGQKPYWEQGATTRPEGAGGQAEYQHRTILKAEEQLIRQNLTDSQDKKIGQVKELMIDRPTGQVALVIARFKGFSRDKDMAALPWEAVTWKWNEERKEGTLGLTVSLDQLKGHMFANKSWPDFNNPAELASIYREFNARPFWERPRDVMGYHE